MPMTWLIHLSGKKRMKSVGNVEVPQEAFMAMLNVKKSEKE